MRIDGKDILVGDMLTNIFGEQFTVAESTDSYVTVANALVSGMNVTQEMLSGTTKRFGIGRPYILWPTSERSNIQNIALVVEAMRTYIKDDL